MGIYYTYRMITEYVSDALEVLKNLDTEFNSKNCLENLLEFKYASSKKWGYGVWLKICASYLKKSLASLSVFNIHMKILKAPGEFYL